jgi:competence protein ComEA
VTFTEAPAPNRDASGAAVAPVDGPIFVHVTGDVAKPGLYRVPAGCRVMDAISYAGGAKETANLDALNLASPLRDGQKLMVPSVADVPASDPGAYLTDSPAPAPPPPVLVRPDPPQPVQKVESESALAVTDAEGASSAPRRGSVAKLRRPGDGTVDINNATETELQRLPGVGPATAAKILAYRQEHGSFSTVEELMEVKGIGPAKLRKMQPFVVLQEPH